MKRIRRDVALVVLAVVVAGMGAPQLRAQVQQDRLRAALVNRIDEAKRGRGVVVGLLTPDGRSFTTYGRVSATGSEPTAETMFEIGSITKVFTALLLADMVERGEVALEDPVRKYLPPSVTIPSRGSRQISLADLATHMSGLPRNPGNMDANDLNNPYASYGPAELYAFLASYTLPRDPGAQWEYSNLATGLLGHALSQRSGVSYEELLRRRVFEPLGMKSTTITLNSEQHVLRATGHDENLSPVSWWDFDVMAGAGAIRSTAADMLVFAEAAMGGDTPLKAAFARMTSVRRPHPNRSVQQALGWGILRMMGTEILAHDGGTHGFRSQLMVDRTNKRAAIVWINGGGTQGVNDLATYAVEPRSQLPMLPVARATIGLDEATVAGYVGTYSLSPTLVITITREAARLFGQVTGQSRFELFAETRDKFFLKVVTAQISFTRGPQGEVNGLVLHQNGKDQPASKQ
jgi:D-alanyl-D-alanine-carboxypeptidase/D-alanyl-D-alanine-endopeptidase